MRLLRVKNEINEMNLIINMVKELIKDKKYEQCEEYIGKVIGKYPHSPEPHNLMGILFEKQNDHENAMKHFRVAWDLDSTYLPARYNIENFGDFFSKSKKFIYDETDIELEYKQELCKVKYDSYGVGHVVKKK